MFGWVPGKVFGPFPEPFPVPPEPPDPPEPVPPDPLPEPFPVPPEPFPAPEPAGLVAVAVKVPTADPEP